MDKILGLEYRRMIISPKPFNILEVKARIKAIIRRNNKNGDGRQESSVVTEGDLKLDRESRRVFIQGQGDQPDCGGGIQSSGTSCHESEQGLQP